MSATRHLKIVLASSSPRRKAVLNQLGIRFEVIEPGEVEESESSNPEDRVRSNALSKARSAAETLRKSLVIAADTVVVLDGQFFGKPENASKAEEMLTALNGREHVVYTGVAILDTDSERFEVGVSSTAVRMRRMTADEVSRYIATGEPMGKAGATRFRASEPSLSRG